MELLLSDQRVDVTRAISEAHYLVVHVIVEDERFGIQANRALFEEHHPKEVARYEELAKERTASICAVSWVMKEIGNGWGDLREPMEERIGRQPLNWEGK